MKLLAVIDLLVYSIQVQIYEQHCVDLWELRNYSIFVFRYGSHLLDSTWLLCWCRARKTMVWYNLTVVTVWLWLVWGGADLPGWAGRGAQVGAVVGAQRVAGRALKVGVLKQKQSHSAIWCKVRHMESICPFKPLRNLMKFLSKTYI